MFYPKLTRRKKDDYKNRNHSFYADYRSNYPKVEDDCQRRCVYCDILVNEYGGDKMQLDHFRPQEHFPDLANDPYNLYLSCPTCNNLKSSHWPASKSDVSASSVNGRLGFIDSFIHTPSDYLTVLNSGKIQAISDPVDYMIKRMDLNRLSRVQVRRKRILNEKIKILANRISKILIDLSNSFPKNNKTAELLYIRKLKHVTDLHKKMCTLL